MKIVHLLTIYLMTVSVLPACSTSKTSVDIPVTNSNQPDYIVRERSPNPAPEWARDFSDFRRKNEGHEANYFLGESGDVSDRLAGCDLSDLDAKKRIAQQIASLISNKIAATKSGQLVVDKDSSNDPGLHRAFEETVASKSMAFLSGIKQYGQYWEERDYSQGGGKKRVYLCMTVVRFDDKDMQTAIRKTANKTEQVQEDPEAKAIVKNALKDIDTQFKNYASSKEN